MRVCHDAATDLMIGLRLAGLEILLPMRLESPFL